MINSLVWRFCFSFAALMSLAGCGSLAIDAPGPMFVAPELPGTKGAVQIGFGSEQATRHEYTSDASARPPNLSRPETSGSGYLYGRAGYSVLDWLEISGSILPGSSLFRSTGIGLTAHAQLLGSGTEPGMKAALYGGYLNMSTSAQGDQNGTFGAGGHNWKAQAWAQTLTLGGSLGVRLDGSNILFFLAAGYADQMVGGSIDHDRSTDGLSPAANYALPQIKGNTRSAGVGMRIGNKVEFALDARYVARSWPDFAGQSLGGGERTETMYTAGFQFR